MVPFEELLFDFNVAVRDGASDLEEVKMRHAIVLLFSYVFFSKVCG